MSWAARGYRDFAVEFGLLIQQSVRSERNRDTPFPENHGCVAFIVWVAKAEARNTTDTPVH